MVIKLNSKEPCLILSVVTVNKNNSKNLERTIHSLRPFKHDSEVECIFIDGNSTDDSVKIASTFYEECNLISEPDTGIYNAMNKGLCKAHGKYVLWLNSGDELIVEDFDKVKTILRKSQTDLISFGVNFFDEQSNLSKFIWTPKKNHLPTHTLPHPSTFFKRDYFIKLGGYNEAYKIIGDRDAFLKMYFAGCSLDVHSQIIAKFYCGGISSTIKCLIENLSVEKYYGLINSFEYYVKFFKLHLKSMKRKLIH